MNLVHETVEGNKPSISSDSVQEQDAEDLELAAALDGWGDDEDAEGEDEEEGSGAHAGPFGHNTMSAAHVSHGGSGAQQEVHNLGGDLDHGMGELGAFLPRELLLRVFAFVSADDLLAAARACRALRDLAGEEVLWRRLYCARWGKPRAQQGDGSWKAQYIQRDAEEASAMDSGDAGQWLGPMQALYRDMRRARRQQALGRGQVDDAMEVPKSELQERLATWRRTHGHPQPPPNALIAQPALQPGASGARPSHGGPCLDAAGHNLRLNHHQTQQQPLLLQALQQPSRQQLQQHQQLQLRQHQQHRLAPAGDDTATCSPSAPEQDAASGSGCGARGSGYVPPARPNLAGPHGRDAYTWDVIGPYYCCRETGWTHLCDHTCREGVVDAAHDCVVCPISCRTIDRLMVTEYELEQEAAARGGHEEGEAPYDYYGFVGRAYEAGYACADERELARVCGVKLR